MSRHTLPVNTNRKVFRVFAYGLIGLMLLFLAVSQSEWLDLTDRVSHALAWGAISLLVLGMVGVIALIYRDSLDRYWQGITFSLTEDRVSRLVEGYPPVEFPLNKISFLGASSSGLTVQSGEPSKQMFIPRAVNDFEELQRQLGAYCKITPIKKQSSWPLIFTIAVTFAVYLLFFTARAFVVVCSAGVLALLLQGWAIFSFRKIWAKTKHPSLVMLAFVGSWLILLWIVYQRVSAVLSAG